jgi:hypothetical protein
MDWVGGGVQNGLLHMDSVWIQPGCQPICRLTDGARHLGDLDLGKAAALGEL